MSIIEFNDEYFMREALKEATKAFDSDEVPVGAVVVSNRKIIARAHNMTEKLNDNTAHAEILAITAAENYLGNKNLSDCTLYVTLEPCPMCAGASYWTRIGKIVYGARDDKRGYTKFNAEIIHPKTKVISGIYENEASELLTEFFRSKRK